jgi:beta-glucosidase
MAVSTGVGRTYRYYTGKPLFEFGHGLSYTTFTLKCANTSSTRWAGCAEPATVKTAYSCDVANTGKMDGEDSPGR